MVNSLESLNRYLLSPLEKENIILLLNNLFIKYLGDEKFDNQVFVESLLDFLDEVLRNVYKLNVLTEEDKLKNIKTNSVSISSEYNFTKLVEQIPLYDFPKLYLKLKLNNEDKDIDLLDYLKEEKEGERVDIFFKKLITFDDVSKNILNLYKYIISGLSKNGMLYLTLIRLVELLNYIIIQEVTSSFSWISNFKLINQKIIKLLDYYIFIDYFFSNRDIFDMIVDLINKYKNYNNYKYRGEDVYVFDNSSFKDKSKKLSDHFPNQASFEDGGFAYFDKLRFCKYCKTIYPYNYTSCDKDDVRLEELSRSFIIKKELFDLLYEKGQLFEAYVYLRIREMVARKYIPCVVSHNFAFSLGNINGEIDIIIYQPFTKKLLIIDCKSTEKIESGDEEKLKEITNELKNSEQLQYVDYLLVNLSKGEEKILPVSQLKERIDPYLNELNK